MRNEKRPWHDLLEIQNTKLRNLIQHAYENIPFYRDLFKKAGLHPTDIQSADDLYTIPIIDKHDFHQRDNTEFLNRRIKDKKSLIPINTSGSSGLSLRFYVDPHHEQFRKAQYLRPYLASGRRLTDRTIRLMNTEMPDHKWFQRLGLLMEYKIYSDSNLDDQIEMINRIKPTIIQGFGSCLGLLASKICYENIPIRRPRLIFTDSELLSDGLRKTIKSGFQADVIDVYGTFETENIAYECARHEGYHITSDCVIMEFIKEGKKVGPGEEGEIVCTVLDNWTMPFIRYNLHDAGSYTDKPCSCGKTFPLMKVIAGRTDDYAVYENGLKKSPRTFLGHFDPLAEFMREYQIIQKEVKSFKVLVVPNREFNTGIERRIKENLWQEFPEAVVDVHLVDKIERGKSGKFRAFVSEVGRTSSGNGGSGGLRP